MNDLSLHFVRSIETPCVHPKWFHDFKVNSRLLTNRSVFPNSPLHPTPPRLEVSLLERLVSSIVHVSGTTRYLVFNKFLDFLHLHQHRDSFRLPRYYTQTSTVSLFTPSLNIGCRFQSKKKDSCYSLGTFKIFCHCTNLNVKLF